MKTKVIAPFIFRFLLASVAVLALGIFLGNLWVMTSARSFMYYSLDRMPENQVGLVLGTSPRLRGGIKNPYFTARIDAAWQLYERKKVSHLILSGYGEGKYYNETEEMKKALVEKGVPDTAITLDPLGFRTLESVIRCHKIFKQNKFTIISQEFHNYRAVFIGRKLGLDVAAFCSTDPASFERMVHGREWLARIKAILDLYVLENKSEKATLQTNFLL